MQHPDKTLINKKGCIAHPSLGRKSKSTHYMNQCGEYEDNLLVLLTKGNAPTFAEDDCLNDTSQDVHEVVVFGCFSDCRDSPQRGEDGQGDG